MDTRGLLGCRLVSEVSLPELPPCPLSPVGPDIVVELASGAMDDFEPAARISPLLEIDRDRACRLRIPGIATFHVRDGARVRIAPDSAAPNADVRRFLLGPVVTLLCHQRGLLPFQGACVSRDRDATLICGLPGSGKSTIAAALVKKGFDVVCDDLIPVGGAAPVVLPTVSRLNLWRNSLDALGIPCDGLTPSRAGQEYYHYAGPEPAIAEALGVARIVVIERAEVSSERLEPLPPRLAVRRLSRAIDEPHLVAALGLQQRLMNGVSRLVEHIPVFGLKCRLSFNELHQHAACFA
jgi:hypothetical protein